MNDQEALCSTILISGERYGLGIDELDERVRATVLDSDEGHVGQVMVDHLAVVDGRLLLLFGDLLCKLAE